MGGCAPRRRRGSRGSRRGARTCGSSASWTSSGSATPHPSPARTPTWPRSTSPKRPARPAIWASSHGWRSRRASPSNFVVSAKRSVSQGRLTPCPSTSVATQTSAARVRKRSISSRREASGIAPYRTATRPGWSRFTSPASARTALRLNATTTVPVPSERSVRSPTHSSGSLRSKTLSSASGNARSTRGSASRAPSTRISRYSPASSSRVQAEPRSSSSAHCTSSRTSSSPEDGAISTVQQRIGARSLTRSSPVISPTFSAPTRSPSRRCASCANIRRGPAYTPAPCAASSSSAACVLPEFVGPRCATTRSGGSSRAGSVIEIPRSARRIACAGRRARSERLGRFWRPRGGRRFRIAAW